MAVDPQNSVIALSDDDSDAEQETLAQPAPRRLRVNFLFLLAYSYAPDRRNRRYKDILALKGQGFSQCRLAPVGSGPAANQAPALPLHAQVCFFSSRSLTKHRFLMLGQ